MAIGSLPKDRNFIAAIGGTSSAVDTASSIRPFQYDPITRGMLVQIVGDDVGIGGGTEYTEDVATANPIVGKAIMVERDNDLSTVTPIEGDNIGLRGTAEGALWTQDFNSDAILVDTTAIKTAVEILDNAISGSEMQVDVITSTLPTGAATAVNQQTDALTDTQLRAIAVPISGTVTANLSAVDNAVLDTIDAVLDTIKVDTEAIQAGQLAAGHSVDTELTTADLDTGAGTDTRAVVGLVGSASGGGELIPGSAADGLLVNLGTNNDVTVTGSVTANAGTNLNTSALATEATLGTIDTDTGNIAAGYAAEGSALGSGVLIQGDDGTDRTNVLVDTDGHLQVDVLSGGGGGTQYAVDAALGATPTGTLAIAIRDDALSALTPVEGDAIGLRVDANGALWVIPSGTTVVSATDLDIRDLTAIDVVTANLSATDNAVLDTIDAVLDTINAKLVTGTDIGDVDVTSITGLTMSNAAAQVTGDEAHDAADAGNPVKIGGKAQTANPTAVAANDRVDAFFDDVGKQVVTLAAPRDLLVPPTIVTITSSTAETTVLASGGAGVFHDLYAIIITNTSATATEVTFKDATAGTNRFKVSAPANDTRGISWGILVPQATAANNWTATCADSVASIEISMFAVKNV